MKRAASLFVPLLFANLLAWIWAFVAFGGDGVLMGTAFLAYSLGLRHAVDAVRPGPRRKPNRDPDPAVDGRERRRLRQGPRTRGRGGSKGEESG